MRTRSTLADTQLALAEVTRRYGDRLVLDRVTLAVTPGERVGVIGDNGSGKSTLLRLMAGIDTPDNGTVTVAAPGGVGHLAQTLGLPGHATVRDAVDLALADLRALERRMTDAGLRLRHDDSPEALAHYAALVAEFEARDGYRADLEVDIALAGLGREPFAPDRRLDTLSGGERARLALAATLAASPELLLLDEPTNDLDDAAVAWLENRLRDHRGTLVAVSHDRAFLDAVTTAVLEVDSDRRTVRRFGTGYAGYLRAKEAERQARLREHARWRDEVSRHTALLDANAGRLAGIPRKAPAAFSGAGAFRARSRAHGAMGRIRNAAERLERLHRDPVPPPPEPLRFTGRVAASAPDGAEVVRVSGLRVAGRLWLDGLVVKAGERLLVTGDNGAGKSTLMAVLAGELAPDSGTVTVTGRTGLLRQDDPVVATHATLLEAFAAGRPGPADAHTDTLRGLGLFRERELTRRVCDLSVGQRRRLELARLVSRPADLLLLDEPTNHLSPVLVEQLEAALADFTGAVIVVTHDRRMRRGHHGPRLHLTPTG
ncbi:macrolide transport system ATP-binding/permease protein [Stackebrandtia albiflava]|uniref:Macrolide transport system ATP-binding/permease protein n=1 Tax=Stackebrandtia albiflava TaxID=406432 RepID=A0A562VAE7_9ACTN|nr:ABC-F family ATP-binding cassette domain-containing protein [Stackebrandtia albiflava]TWJ14834.1 macrolide transport system ATP-binding/permease protein [Stackebrandtia albiflava]